MPPLCAENNNLLQACMASSARSEASLVAIAQQLMQQQQQHKHAHSLYPYSPHHLPSSSSQGHQASMDHWAPSSCWQQAKTEDFASSLYSDAICDLPSVMDFSSASALLLPSLDSHMPEESGFPLSKPNEEALLSIHTPEMSQTLTSVDDVDDLVDGLLPHPAHPAAAQPPSSFDFVDPQAQWLEDCFMYDTDDPLVPYFDTNPCESSQSSEPATSSDLIPCTPLENALPDAFALMEAANFYSPNWTQDSANDVASSRDMLGMCPSSRNAFGMCSTSRDMAGVCGAAAASQDFLGNAQQQAVMGGMHVKRSRAGEAGGWHGSVKKGGGKVGMTSMSVCERGRLQHRQNQVAAHGVQLMQLLLECAKAVENDHSRAAMVIPQLKATATRNGDPIQRLAAYFTEALCRRLARAQGREEVGRPSIDCSVQELTLAYKAMNEACPYFTFAQLTANQAILETIKGAEKLHIVDFGISQGEQWAAMLQAIAGQEGHALPSRITITGVASPELGGERAESLAATGRRLSDFARHLNLNLEFRYVSVPLGDATLAAHMFHIEAGEVVVVNFMLELCNLLDGGADVAVAQTLKVAAELEPRLVTVAEMDACLNRGAYQKRFVSALHFFSAMFDSLEAGMSRESVHRLWMERWMLGERIHEMVGGEDEGRRRRLQTHGEWRAALQAGGFQPCALSHYARSQARILLWRFCESFTLDEQQAGCLTLGWQSKPLLTVSAWTIHRS